ncbi:DegT/DnrJ/EryC1/StrS aminotransferase family protein [Actinocrispum wychmicini]|uniref:DegT/DnrJ/EryC1/StrS aminotransferase family protein n=1 Tax=Actinocrispum wychmicini TaxID=1213861 RepID=A0A4R2IPC2_9PSEU|nr:DegT/DnrJ/EryC1/StrS aminotransferase family protein [Actinocrispum wychmicini]
MSTFSFHANKAVTTGEGGSASTNDAELAATMRLLVNHGMTPEEPYVHRILGRKFRMTNLVAAVGVGQVQRWDDLVAARLRVSERYRELLPDACSGPACAPWARRSCWLHTIRVPRRTAVVDRLRGAGIDARPIWPALDRQPVLAHVSGNFPVAHAIAGAAMWLPTYGQLRDDKIQYIAEHVTAAVTDVGPGEALSHA